jgi:hypothetical protein
MNNGAGLAQLLQRLGESADADAFFGADEVLDWPEGTLDALTGAGLLRPAPAARILECSGCEENCLQPVHVVPSEGGRSARALIVCDRREDVGRVSIPLERLRQWRLGGVQLAQVVAGLLGFECPPEEEPGRNAWTLGSISGKKRRAQLSLRVEGGVTLHLAGHAVPLGDLLSARQGRLELDRKALIPLADNPAPASTRGKYVSSTARREARKLDTQAQYESWRKAHRELHRKHGAKGYSDVWYSQQIAKMKIANGKDPETIRKHMKGAK